MALLDLLFPVECVVCGTWETILCESCSERLERPSLQSVVLVPAGTPVQGHENSQQFVVRAAREYCPRTAAVLLAYKRQPAEALVRPLAVALAVTIAAVLRQVQGPALLVPVPTSRRAYLRRGFDPVRRLVSASCHGASECGEFSTLPWSFSSVLCRPGWGSAQKGLGSRARLRNVRGAFAVRWAHRSALQGRECVLVDDVCTTGSTLVQARRTLLAAGAHCRRAAVIAAVRAP